VFSQFESKGLRHPFRVAGGDGRRV
jgi:hypothetical protein